MLKKKSDNHSNMKVNYFSGVLSLLFISGMTEVFAQSYTYPQTRKDDVSDTYFGREIKDPYRWLENDTSAETAAWVIAQNKVTSGVLEAIPFRADYRKRMLEVVNYPRYGGFFKAGEYYLFSKNDGLQNQSIYYRQKGLNGIPEVFIDPNKLSSDGTVSVSLVGVSKSEKLIGVTFTKAGSDWKEVRVYDIATGKELEDKVEWVKFTNVSWRGDEGFYYSRYPKPEKGTELSAQSRFNSVWYHKLGDSQEKDQLVYEDKENALRYHSVYLTEDERYMVLVVGEGTNGFETWVKDLKNGDKSFRQITSGFANKTSIIDNEGDLLIARTDIGAPNYRVVMIDPRKPDSNNWKTIVAEKNYLLENVSKAGESLFAIYLKDVATEIIQLKRDGEVVRKVELPAAGTAFGFTGKKTDKEVFYAFSSLNYPPTWFRYSLSDGKSDLFKKSESSFNPASFEVKQVFYPSKDGTSIPMFIMHKKGINLDKNNPTLLYAYGGFNINLSPSFNPFILPFVEQGGVYAIANLRGGGEYGEDWHKAGMKEKKQNVFDDFIAAAEYLNRSGYSRPEKLAIQGGSNGGLLVGAVMTQRPDLFRVAIPMVGVMDMLRFQKFTVGWGWVAEYGSSDNQSDFEYLIKYSPLHNIKNKAYPATLVTTADHDDRVVPAHSFKYIAELQDKHTGDLPVLIRIETNAGHGAGTALTKSIDLYTDIGSFILHFTNHTVNFK